MNQYSPGFEYANMFHGNSLSYPIKVEEPFDYDLEDRDDSSSQGVLQFMKPHFYNPVPYPEYFWNQRRRSPESPEPLDLDTSVSCITPPGADYQQREYPTRPQKMRPELRRMNCEELFATAAASGQKEVDNLGDDRTPKSRKLYHCRSCGKTFKFQTSLLRHNNKVHINKYQCQTCQRRFSRQAYLDTHLSKQGSSCFVAAVAARSARNVRSGEVVHYPDFPAASAVPLTRAD